MNVRLPNSQRRQHRIVGQFKITLRMIRRNVSFIGPEEMNILQEFELDSVLDFLFQSLVISQYLKHLFGGRAAGESDRKLHLNRQGKDKPRHEESRRKTRHLIRVGKNSDRRFHPHFNAFSISATSRSRSRMPKTE